MATRESLQKAANVAISAFLEAANGKELRASAFLFSTASRWALRCGAPPLSLVDSLMEEMRRIDAEAEGDG
jgi:hypothetical protein